VQKEQVRTEVSLESKESLANAVFMHEKINYNCNKSAVELLFFPKWLIDLKSHFQCTVQMNDNYSTRDISARFETVAKTPITQRAFAKEP
jgi:hypothetical protein